MENKVQPTILVTGFGPFRDYKVNASWEAVKLLPMLFEESEKLSFVNIVVEEIAVAYDVVSQSIKELWNKHRPEIIIHVGVSYSADCLRIECQANSKGYTSPDINEKCPNENNIEHVTLQTSCNVDEICNYVNKNSSESGCQACTSDDAGRYLCEYIYYQSLSIGEPQVLFVHVPELHVYSNEKTAKGLLQIIKYLIENVIEKRNCDKAKIIL